MTSTSTVVLVACGVFGALALFGTVVGAVMFFQQRIPGRPKITIHYARYGTGIRRGEYKDVTAHVRDHVGSDGRVLDFEVSNENLGGDPFKMERKKLWVAYSFSERVCVDETHPERRTRLTIQRSTAARVG